MRLHRIPTQVVEPQHQTVVFTTPNPSNTATILHWIERNSTHPRRADWDIMTNNKKSTPPHRPFITDVHRSVCAELRERRAYALLPLSLCWRRTVLEA